MHVRYDKSFTTIILVYLFLTDLLFMIKPITFDKPLQTGQWQDILIASYRKDQNG
jgi:hypothetical protein